MSRPRWNPYRWIEGAAALCAGLLLVAVAVVVWAPRTSAAARTGAPRDRQMHDHDLGSAPVAAAPLRSNIRGPAAGTSRAPAPALDAGGRLWLAWVEGGYVFVSSSADRGRTFAPAVAVNAAPENIDANSESRPKLALGPSGQIYVTYTKLGVTPYTGDVRFSRSTDDGRTFSAPITLNDDHRETGHRFDALAVAPNGNVFVAWIDKRDLDAEKGAQAGASVYYTVSADGGRTFAPNRKLTGAVCECCRLSAAFDPDGRLALVWRAVLPGEVRDHSIGWISAEGSPIDLTRATRDGWRINACPHHGPSLSVTSDGTYHLVWFTAEGPQGAGAFYARSVDHGRTFSAPRRLADGSQAHAVVLSQGRRVCLAWKQRRGAGGSVIYVQQSGDAGNTWSEPKEILATAGASVHPLLVRSTSNVFLSWFTAGEGYRLVAVPSVPRSWQIRAKAGDISNDR